MKQLKAIKGHTYGNKFRKVGDVYEATEANANLMVLLKNSEYYVEPVVVPKPKRSYVRKDQTAGKPGGYNRKDLKAE